VPDAPSRRKPTFFARLGETERTELLAVGQRRAFREDEILMLQGERDTHLLLLLEGRVKVTRSAQGEHELLLAIRDAGDLLGELAFIDGEPRSATVTALEPGQALVLSARAFRAHLESAPHVAITLLEAAASRFRESTLRQLQFAASDTLGRLAARIVELVERYGEPGAEGIAVAMPISQEELASWTGASRAAASQGLQALRELGWITTERGRLVVLDLAALRSRSA